MIFENQNTTRAKGKIVAGCAQEHNQMTQKLTLEEWCNEIYPGKKPSRQTLQRWARNGNFYPAAEKEGREYRLTPGTIYINPKDLNLGRKIKEARSIEPARAAFMEKVINDTAKGGV